MMLIDNKLEIGDHAWMITGEKQEGIVTGIMIRPAGQIVYVVTIGTEEEHFYDFEITLERQIA